MIYHAIYHPALEDYTQDGAMTINGLLKGWKMQETSIPTLYAMAPLAETGQARHGS